METLTPGFAPLIPGYGYCSAKPRPALRSVGRGMRAPDDPPLQRKARRIAQSLLHLRRQLERWCAHGAGGRHCYLGRRERRNHRRREQRCEYVGEIVRAVRIGHRVERHERLADTRQALVIAEEQTLRKGRRREIE